jgi:hypothetical protein
MYSSTHSLTWALDGCEWSASHPARSTPRERAPGIHWIGWVGPRAVLDAEMRKNSQPLPGIEPKNPDHPPHSPELYRLSYHDSQGKDNSKSYPCALAEHNAMKACWGVEV